MRLEGRPGEPLREAWAYLNDDEAHELLQALSEWASETQRPGWHTHVGEPGAELTIAVGPPDADTPGRCRFEAGASSPLPRDSSDGSGGLERP